MANGLNKIQIIGNMGKDAEMRYLPNGTPITKFSVAVTRSWKGQDDDEWKQETTWFNVEAWRKLAEKCADWSKGNKVYVEGRMQENRWTGEDGQEKRRWSINAAYMMNLTGKPKGDNEPDDDSEAEGDEIPF